MSKQFTSVDFQNIPTKRFVFENLTTTEITALALTLTQNNKGRVVYDTVLKQQFIWDGTIFVQSGGGLSISTGSESVILLNIEEQLDLYNAAQPSLFADGRAGSRVNSDNLLYYKNDTAGKINWYFFQPTGVSYNDLKSIYFIANKIGVRMPYIQVYTKPQGAGDLGAWYRSRYSFEIGTNADTGISQYFAIGDADVEFGLNSVPLIENFGNQDQKTAGYKSEEILYIVLGAGSTTPLNEIEFELSEIGYQLNSGKKSVIKMANKEAIAEIDNAISFEVAAEITEGYGVRLGEDGKVYPMDYTYNGIINSNTFGTPSDNGIHDVVFDAASNQCIAVGTVNNLPYLYAGVVNSTNKSITFNQSFQLSITAIAADTKMMVRFDATLNKGLVSFIGTLTNIISLVGIEKSGSTYSKGHETTLVSGVASSMATITSDGAFFYLGELSLVGALKVRKIDVQALSITTISTSAAMTGNATKANIIKTSTNNIMAVCYASGSIYSNIWNATTNTWLASNFGVSTVIANNTTSVMQTSLFYCNSINKYAYSYVGDNSSKILLFTFANGNSATNVTTHDTHVSGGTAIPSGTWLAGDNNLFVAFKNANAKQLVVSTQQLIDSPTAAYSGFFGDSNYNYYALGFDNTASNKLYWQALGTVDILDYPIIGIAQENQATIGGLVKVIHEGEVSSAHTGLTPNNQYYFATDGALTATENDNPAGIALTDKKLNVVFSTSVTSKPSLVVIDNTITDPSTITVQGRYIVPSTGGIDVFVGNANKYADFDGITFSFATPLNNDKISIATGTNAGKVYTYSTSTSTWTLQTQTTSLATDNYNSAKAYNVNDLVIRNNKIYQANSNIPANTAFAIGTTGATWKKISELPDWVLTGIYETGDVVKKDGMLYEANGNIPTNTVFVTGTTGATWRQINNGVVAEYGSAELASDLVVIANTDTDIMSFTLPSAGVWEVTYQASTEGIAGGAGNIIRAWLADMSNVVVDNSSQRVSYAQTTSLNTPVSQTVRITTTGSQQFKLRGRSSLNSSWYAGAVKGTDFNTNVIWKKISGFAPVVGQATSYRSAQLSTTLVGGGLVGQDMVVVGNSVGNLPFSSGIWTLTAGITYQLFSSLIYDAGANGNVGADINVFFVDATTNATLSNQTGSLIINESIYGRTILRNGVNSFTYTPSTNQTIKLRVTNQSNAGILTAQTFIQQIGTTNTSAFTGVISNSWNINNGYPSGTIVINNGVYLYQANSFIPANTPFTTGTTGATWKQIGMSSLPEWTDGGAITLGATTTAPTKPTTRTADKIYYKQIGAKTWQVEGVISWASATGSLAGSGDYLITLPNSLQFDNTILTQAAYAGNIGANNIMFTTKGLPGSNVTMYDNFNYFNTSPSQVIPYDSTRFRVILYLSGSGIRPWGSSWIQMDTSRIMELRFSFTFQSLN